MNKKILLVDDEKGDCYHVIFYFHSNFFIKKACNRRLQAGLHGGRDGIRTHVPRRTTAFRVRLVMTTSILFHVNAK